MPRAKVAISLDEATLTRLDQLIREAVFPNRSRAIQQALDEKLQKLDQTRLARECAKLAPAEEKALAEEGLEVELAEWPEY